MSQAPALPTAEDLKALVAAKATHDAAFRAEVLANPRAAIEKLFGIDLPAHVKLQAIEEPADTHVVVVPRAAAVAPDGELSDDDLEAVAGGSKKSAKKFFNTVAGGLQDAASFVNDVAGYAGNQLTGAMTMKNTAQAIGNLAQSNSNAMCGKSAFKYN